MTDYHYVFIHLCIFHPLVPLSVRLSALKCLSVIVRTVGVLLPSQVCEPLRKLAVTGFSLNTAPQQALSLLDLLLASVTTSNAQLRASLGSALRFFNMGTQHQSAKVCLVLIMMSRDNVMSCL